jgi:hypothetical protein
VTCETLECHSPGSCPSFTFPPVCPPLVALGVPPPQVGHPWPDTFDQWPLGSRHSSCGSPGSSPSTA